MYSLGNTAVILHVCIYSLIEILCKYSLSWNSDSIRILPDLVSVINYSSLSALWYSLQILSLTGNKASGNQLGVLQLLRVTKSEITFLQGIFS